MANGNSAAGVGLQAGAGLINILGSVLGGRKAERRDRRIAQGEETPEMRALRARLAGQNAQTAMQVAASQPGVNPALAQRNAQQALSQAQVSTNADLARLGVQQAESARGRADQSRQRRIGAGVQGASSFANSLGAMLTTQGAQQQLQQPAEPATDTALPGAVPSPGVDPETGLLDIPGFSPVLDPSAAQSTGIDAGAGLTTPVPGQTQLPPTGVVQNMGAQVDPHAQLNAPQPGMTAPQPTAPAEPGAQLGVPPQSPPPGPPGSKEEATAQSQTGTPAALPDDQRVMMGIDINGQPLQPPPSFADIESEVMQMAVATAPKDALARLADFREQAQFAGDDALDEQLYQLALGLQTSQQVFDLLESERIRTNRGQ